MDTVAQYGQDDWDTRVTGMCAAGKGMGSLLAWAPAHERSTDGHGVDVPHTLIQSPLLLLNPICLSSTHCCRVPLRSRQRASRPGPLTACVAHMCNVDLKK